MAGEATAENQEAIITALGTINTALGTLNTNVGKVETAVKALKTELTSQMDATNKNMSYLGSGGAVSTGVDSQRTFVIAPWPPVAETTEDSSDDTGDDTTTGGE